MKMKVIVKRPDEEYGRIVLIENKLKTLQQIVGGYIEVVSYRPNLLVICNEEGKFNGLEGNRRIGRDIIAGVFYVVGETDDGDLASLPQEKIAQYMERFREPEYYTASDVEHALFMSFF